MTVRFVIVGPPRTKGNSRVFATAKGKPLFLPSKQYQAWFKAAKQQVPIIRMATRIIRPLTCPVRVEAVFYRDRAAGDLDNYEKGLGDFLQRAGLIANDQQISSWGESRLDKDAARPRVEVTLTTMEPA